MLDTAFSKSGFWTEKTPFAQKRLMTTRGAPPAPPSPHGRKRPRRPDRFPRGRCAEQIRASAKPSEAALDFQHWNIPPNR